VCIFTCCLKADEQGMTVTLMIAFSDDIIAHSFIFYFVVFLRTAV
jgi:hypothetical protein